MAQLLVSSALRTGFEGDLMVFTNADHRLFEFGRDRLQEIAVAPEMEISNETARSGKSFKFLARNYIDAKAYDTIMFADCDALFLKNPDELGPEDAQGITYAIEPDSYARPTDEWHCGYLTDAEMKEPRAAINSGLWRIGGGIYSEVMQQWEEVCARPAPRKHACTDQSAWIRVVLDSAYAPRPFHQPGAIRYPFFERGTMHEFESARFLHFAGMDAATKLSYMVSTYLRRFCPAATHVLFDSLTMA